MSIKAIILCRVSSVKQTEGASLEEQESKGLKLAFKYGYVHKDIKVIREVYTGTKSLRPIIEETHKFCLDNPQVERIFILDIDRFSRAGAAFYEKNKARFYAHGVQLVDVNGVIQEERNMLEGIGGDFGKDKSYSWSVFSPSENAEIMKAQQSKDEVRKILLRTIPKMIENTKKGYESRASGYGYRNKKIICPKEGKRRVTREICPEEAKFVREIFEMKANGFLSVEICEKLNKEGFKTRIKNRWNKEHTQIIGEIGGNLLTPQYLGRILENVANAGFKCEEWTWKKLVKAQHKPIVSTELWNNANKGKFKIIKDDESITGWRLLKSKDTIRVYSDANPKFPFKSVIKCPVCDKKLKGASSRGKNKKRYPFYFCNRGHKQVSITPKELDSILVPMFKQFRFQDHVTITLEVTLKNLWSGELKKLNSVVDEVNNNKRELEDRAKEIINRISILSNKDLIRIAEKEYENILEKIAISKNSIDNKVYKEEDIIIIIRYMKRFVEHLDKLALDTDKQRSLNGFWSLLFVELPTLEDIRSRNLKISPIIEYKETLKTSKKQLVCQTFDESKLLTEIKRWAEILPSLFNYYDSL